MRDIQAHFTLALMRTYAQGRLEAADAEALERHVFTCTACMAKLEKVQREVYNQHYREAYGPSSQDEIDAHLRHQAEVFKNRLRQRRK